MRILFALPGLHRYDRGAEVAFLAVARELARGGDEVTLIGNGPPRPDAPYRYMQVPMVRRERFERFPSLPALRVNTSYEELSFVPGLLARYRPADFDLTVTCSFPYTNLALRRIGVARRPRHVFVTQNGDWPAFAQTSEYRLFGCDGLVCTNPDYYARNHNRWNATLIPNGIDAARFIPGPGNRRPFRLPEHGRIVLMVSAMIASKRVADGIRAVAALPDTHLVCAGDGPLRAEVDQLAAELMPERFTRLSVRGEEMPTLYRTADAFLHLSTDESFGNVYVEALACGLPIVAHDIDRVRWIVGDDAYLVDTTNPALLDRALRKALEDDKSSGSSRHARAAEFAWPIIAARYRDFFETLLN